MRPFKLLVAMPKYHVFLQVTEMVVNITRAFSRNLVNVDWMDVTTKAAAFAKVLHFRN